MQLSKLEQETVISFNEDEKTANVYTFNSSLQKQLEQLQQERPDECKLYRESCFGKAKEYTIPKKWIKIRPPRILTEEHKALRRNIISQVNQQKHNVN